MFQSEVFQRPFQYLQGLEANKKTLPIFNRFLRSGNKRQCLETLMRHCCVEDPLWSELRNFVHFLNTQLEDFEKSVYCGSEMAADLPGFSKFVLRFLIQMSKDFSTRSLMMSEDEENIESIIHEGQMENENEETNDENEIIDLSQFQIRRRWESSAHPYLFFNPDHHTMTFIGFNISKVNRNLVDNQTGQVLERKIMTPNLWDALVANCVPLQENFEDLNRYEKLERLCRVIGNEFPHDPDETYELTTDNVKKMMAIYMRFRCNIPVIVMGETGCGKTRLIKFLCALQCPPGAEIKKMAVMKVHGGTTKKHIIEKVRKAEETAKANCESSGNHIFTVLFFDEANTTEAIGSIKEIMCDGTIDGRPINLNENLKLVAACNPYRKHPDEMIARLEKAGLGYHVNVEETTDRLGRIPMRHLVYRVQPLPQSMIPLVWDFGQLDSTVERLYIIQMLNRYDECSFVSLRDVERTLKVFGWFYNQTNLFEEMDEIIDDFTDSDTETSEDEVVVHEFVQTFVHKGFKTRDHERITRSIILALGVCYHASLKNREVYRNHISGYFRHPLNLQSGGRQIEKEIKKCQRIFLEKVNLNENIAKNMALRENFFMMVVCVELGIPLFLVGKPGSSKSLSKSILDQNMQGRESHSELFKNFKQVQIISFQCSPLATAEGILKTFQQASKLQENKDLSRFTSVVVLDEVGLAEDSPRMPLKALHPLLEDGCPDDEEYQEHKKVAFIGISNWALDPAKMNRGILVQREVPDEEELIESARGICSTNEEVRELLEDLIPKLAKGYLQVFQKTITTGELFGTTSRDQLKAREFFGLRDFYSLVKMMFAIASRSMEIPTPKDIAYVIRRNFGGLQGLDPVAEFSDYVDELQEFKDEEDGFAADVALVRKCLEHGSVESESRYVLLLTENYSALTLLEQLLTTDENTQILFGSSFPKDQEYIEICRNINRIKVFMETGKTVVLLNLENLYESLYDALNQYYMESGSERFIDLGLGTHRVKCKVDRNFRLIVVAEKRVVYKEFPIPLINRLEKHFLTMEGLLTNAQLRLSKELTHWVEEFSACPRQSVGPEEVFIGYNQDTCPGVILQSWDLCTQKHDNEDDDFMEDVLRTAKYLLLWSCTPDALFRLQFSSLSMFREEYTKVYFDQQCHDSLCSFLQHRIDEETFRGHFIQVTTHSKLLSMEDKQDIENNIPILQGKIALLSLQAFGTEQQFSRQIREIAQEKCGLLIIQCDTGDENSNLVSCARHCVQREMNNSRESCIIFLVHLSRVCKAYFTGFQTGLWSSVHIDDLRLSTLPSAQKLFEMTLSELLNESLKMQSDGEKKIYKVDMRKLFLDCLHPALASISDMSESGETSIDRVKTVFALLEKEHGLTQGHFGYVVMQHLVKIIALEEEDLSMLDHSSLVQRAADIGNISKCGTLRSSCSKSIEGRVIPLLARIICFLDTNNNLQILDNACECSWVYIAWMRMFSAVDAKILNKERELVTQSTGKNIGFKSIFPFSWLLFENVEKILQSCYESKIGNSAEELFSQSPMAMIINDVTKGKDTIPAMQLYISDFVNMKCTTFSIREKQLICESLVANIEQRPMGIPESLSDRLVCIHSVFKGMEDSVKTFCDIASLLEHLQNEKFFEHVQNSYQMLDIGSVKYLLEKLNPIDAIESRDGQTFWMQQFQFYKPFIERILHQSIETLQPGNPRRRFIEQMRSTWAKITALKLYIENIAGDEKTDKLINQDCKFLWKYLGENANFKSIETVEKFEKFLKASNKKAMKDFLDKFGKCHYCQKTLSSTPPIILPCGHRICRENCQVMIITEGDIGKCPECSVEFENGAEYDRNEVEREEMKPFWDYQKKSNKFYMQIESQLCFENSTAPSEEVCKKLLQLVVFKKKIPELDMTIIRTKDIGVFETIVDTTPVFRSFLLQLLIRSNEDTVLQLFLKETVEVFDDGIHGSHMKDICLMLIQCIEDSLMEESLSQSFQSEMEREIRFAKELMLLAKEQLQSEGKTVDKIKSIARARFGLQVTARYLHKLLNASWEFTESELAMCTDLFQTSASLCDSPLEHIRMYLLKHICRRYGLEFYRNLQSSNESWVFPSEDGDHREKESTEQYSPDYCLVLGEQYRKIKEKISEILVPTDMSKKLKLKDKSRTVQVFFLLGLCREMKSRSLFQEEKMQTKEQLKCKLQKLLKNQKLQIVMGYLEEIFDDSLGRSCEQLTLSLCDNMHEESIIFLILHLMFVLKVTGNKGQLLPLHALAYEPNVLENVFLPTMPEECLSREIQEELQRMEKIANKTHHNFTWYRCPNGHLYGVGDCGNPTQKGRCYECNAEIGSELERNRADNVKYTGDDQSRRGHILGTPSDRSFDAVSERNLSPISNAVLRVLIHLSMFIGANYNIEEMTKLIHPTVHEDDVPQFLWDHILVDISTLRKTLDQGLDGVFMLLHVLVHSFLREEPPLAVASRNNQDTPVHILQTKDGRKLWEMEFSMTYIAEVLQKSKELFKTCEDILSEDTSIVSDPVLRRVFDLDDATREQFNFNEMQTCEFMWQHRIKVSFEHFVHEFHMLRDRLGPEVERFVLLDAFLRQDCYLRYLRYIPAVVRMQSVLKAKYRKQITREEARSITIRDCLQQCRQDPFSKEIEDGVVSICELWKCFRKFYFDFETQDMNKEIEALLERNIDVDVDSVSLLIPDTRGSGTIISLLFRFMIGKQNAFMKLFEDLTQTRTSHVKDISFDELATSDLISYHHKADLLPIIISNCNYTYAKDERTTLDYDFDSIQSAIKNQILQGKPILNVSAWKWPWNTVYRADADMTRFATLNARINQKPLDKMLQRQIITDFTDLPDIYEAIENIDTVVNFLLSVNCSGDDLLSEFMENILQMSSLLSQKASVSCRLHHVQSLWFLFMFEKTKRLTLSEKDGFESIHENIKEPLSEQMCKDLCWYLTDLSTEKLGVILEQLLECILFTLNQGQWNYGSYSHSLSETLMVHLEDPIYSEVDLKTLGLNDVQRLPSTILSSHSVEVWKMISRIIQSRE
ncbi:E3 ubiquitin-protein ligase rnf213-alpha-like isoform X2 [Saccostrea cucullata]|uniref:E3 ubiquitin-protein ligase rnf213-alpha-like isoform X2 n=1 Tax=Saccostrea cuccullata TaxID=36930 RepID=UPI002ED61C49